MSLVVGIDPGLDGALCFLELSTLRVAGMVGMPTMRLGKGKGSKREISAQTLVIMIERELGRLSLAHAFLERVASSPQMGVTSAFQFGRGYGTIEGIIAALGWPVRYVSPQKWKKALAVPAEKDDARVRACQLLPRDVDLWTPQRGVFNSAQAAGRAEAALIALWGAQQTGFLLGVAAE